MGISVFSEIDKLLSMNACELGNVNPQIMVLLTSETQ